MADADSITRCFRASDRMASWGLVLVLTPDVILRENNTSCYSRGNDRPRRRRRYTDRSIVFAGWRQYHTHPAPSNTWFFGQYESMLKPARLGVGHFCRVHPCAQRTDRQKNRDISATELPCDIGSNRSHAMRPIVKLKVKVKFSHTRYRALGPELIPVYRQSARR